MINANQRTSRHASVFLPLRRRRMAWCVMSVLLLCAPGILIAADDQPRTDALYLPGVNIPIANITVERIAAGQVIYRDSRGRRTLRNMDEIGSLRFAEIPQLDRAEAHAAQSEYQQAIPHYLQALVHATNETQRLWIHSRLARAHDIRGEYARAVSHVAAVFLLEEHIAWRDIEPIREPEGDVSFAAVAEARHMLREAQRQITHRELSRAVTRMSERIEQMYEQAAAAHDGPPVEPRTTWSGYAIERIRAGEFDDDRAEAGENDGLEHPAPDAAEPEPQPADEPRAAVRGEHDPDAIERLLDEARFDEALARCRQIERDLGERDVARFLYQYGRALAGKAQFDEAAIMFTRCAILHPNSPHAPSALIETAAIYLEHYEQRPTAHRLLDRAERMLDESTPSALRNRITRMRDE